MASVSVKATRIGSSQRRRDRFFVSDRSRRVRLPIPPNRHARELIVDNANTGDEHPPL
jgi:hypothetical protein